MGYFIFRFATALLVGPTNGRFCERSSSFVLIVQLSARLNLSFRRWFDFIFYLFIEIDSGCLLECLDHLQQMRLPKQDALETFYSLFHIQSESTNISAQLLEDFYTGNGYAIITEYLLK